MAKTNSETEDAPKGPKIVAEWVGDLQSPRIDGRTVRMLSKKEVADGLIIDLTRDLRWGAETAYRADVTAEPPAFHEWLKKQPEFKVTEE